MERSAAIVQGIADSEEPAYGISTGFGSLAMVRIPAQARAQLQRALVRSHAAGMGPPVEREVVRAMMVLRARTLAMGCSGARPVVAEAFGQQVRLLERDAPEQPQSLRREPQRCARRGQRGDHRTSAIANGRGHGGDTGLELVDAWAEAPAGICPGPVTAYLEALTEVDPGDDAVVLPPLVTVVCRRPVG